MIVSDQSLHSGHHHNHLSVNLQNHKTRRKINQINNRTTIQSISHTRWSYKFSNSSAISSSSSAGGGCNIGRRYVCNNAMDGDGSVNKGGVSAEEVVLYEEGGRKRKVKCEVEVVSWRERRVKSEVEVDADVDSVWKALTDYERLADFIPNLIFSARIPCAHPGRIWLEQRGLQRALYWHIEARVVLDLQEFPNSFRLTVVNSTSLWLMEISRNLKANGLSNQGEGLQQQFCLMK